jgi:hypothetical protein
LDLAVVLPLDVDDRHLVLVRRAAERSRIVH